MPEMGGEETLERMLEIRPELRVILATGNDAHEIAGYETAGRTAIVQKPFGLEELAAKLMEIGFPAEKRRKKPC